MDDKRLVGKKFSEIVKDGMVLGIGTGSTSAHAIFFIGERIKNEGLKVYGVPTSFQAKQLAVQAGIKIINNWERIDIAFDGADEVDKNLNLIKGRGAALSREKVIDSFANKFIVLVDESKLVEKLGSKPVPVEVLPFAWRTVQKLIGGELRMGVKKDGPVITDNGNFILDVKFGEINNPEGLERKINNIPGVIDNGLFTNIVSEVYVGSNNKVKILKKCAP